MIVTQKKTRVTWRVLLPLAGAAAAICACVLGCGSQCINIIISKIKLHDLSRRQFTHKRSNLTVKS